MTSNQEEASRHYFMAHSIGVTIDCATASLASYNSLGIRNTDKLLKWRRRIRRNLL